MNGLRIQILREVHEAPAWASEYLASVGGSNRFGEPNLRVVWSNSRLGLVGGKYEERDTEGYLVREVFKLQRIPKYPVENRFIIEQWVAPEKFGTPQSWLKKTREYELGNLLQLGPYPSRGEYQLSSVLETTEGQFLPLRRYLLEDFWMQFRWKRTQSYLGGLLLEKQAIEKKKQKQIESDAEWAKSEMRSSLFVHDSRSKSVNQYL